VQLAEQNNRDTNSTDINPRHLDLRQFVRVVAVQSDVNSMDCQMKMVTGRYFIAVRLKNEFVFNNIIKKYFLIILLKNIF
jgi:hypothetical protein